jgi:hypothetical protein
VPLLVQGALVPRVDEVLLLELEAPVSVLPAVEGVFDRWVGALDGRYP